MTIESPSAEASRPTFFEKALESVKTKGLKYSMVSVVNVVFGQLLITGLQSEGWDRFGIHIYAPHLGRTKSNFLAVIISAIPAYYMSRLWVWGKRGKSELRREVLPFWIFVGIGLLVSTFAVTLVNQWWIHSHDTDMPKLFTNIVNLGSFGVLWVVRFFWMDKAFHLDHHHGHGPLDVLLDEDEPV